jgi:hypothetical protein
MAGVTALFIHVIYEYIYLMMTETLVYAADTKVVFRSSSIKFDVRKATSVI